MDVEGKAHAGLPHRLRQIDGLRGLAALVVAFYHYTHGFRHVIEQSPSSGPAIISDAGHFAVELFFVISGFVIFGTLQRARSGLDFGIARIGRLYPAYLCCASITLLCSVLTGFNVNHVRPIDLLLNLVIGLPHFLLRSEIDPSYWTLTFEVLFYAISGVLFFGLRVRRMEYAALAWLAVVLVARPLLVHSHRLAILTDAPYAHLFLAGMLLQQVTTRTASRASWAALALALVLCAMPMYEHGGLTPLWVFLRQGTVILLVALAARNRLTLLQWPPILFLGDISYSWYLLHQIIGYRVMVSLEYSGLPAGAAVLAAFVVTISLAYLVRRNVELPGQKMILAAYRNRLARSPRAAVQPA